MTAAPDPFEERGVAVVPDAPEVEDIFDLDALIAEREEKAPFVFRFGGEAYSLPPRPDLRAAAAFSDERINDGFRILLGAAQWERLQAAEQVFDDKAFESMYLAYQAHIGADLGESSASAKSSRATARK